MGMASGTTVSPWASHSAATARASASVGSTRSALAGDFRMRASNCTCQPPAAPGTTATVL